MTNVVVLRGRVNRPPADRTLPSGDRLTSIDLTVPGGLAGVAVSPRNESVPLAWFDAPAWVSALGPGAELLVAGRVRRRFFRAGAGLQSRTEVVVDQAAPLRHVAKCVALLRRVTDEIAAAEPGNAPPKTMGTGEPGAAGEAGVAGGRAASTKARANAPASPAKRAKFPRGAGAGR